MINDKLDSYTISDDIKMHVSMKTHTVGYIQ